MMTRGFGCKHSAFAVYCMFFFWEKRILELE